MPVHYGEATPDQETAQVPALSKKEGRVRTRFSMVIDPNAWEWYAELGEYLPRLRKLKHDPGVNGVGLVGAGKNARPDISLALAREARRGRTVILDGDARLHSALPGGKYLARWKSQTGRWAYGWCWEGFEVVNGATYWESDDEKKIGFLRFLLSVGICPPMNPRLKWQTIRRVKRAVNRLQTAHESSPDKTSVLMRLNAQKTYLAALEADHSGANQMPKVECAEDGCSNKASSRSKDGLCQRHDKAQRAAATKTEASAKQEEVADAA